MRLSPVPATLLFAAGGAALLTDNLVLLGVLAAALLAAVLRAPAERRLPYLFGAIATGLGVFFVSPLVASVGYDVLWEGARRSRCSGSSTSRPRSSRRRR